MMSDSVRCFVRKTNLPHNIYGQSHRLYNLNQMANPNMAIYDKYSCAYGFNWQFKAILIRQSIVLKLELHTVAFHRLSNVAKASKL